MLLINSLSSRTVGKHILHELVPASDRIQVQTTIIDQSAGTHSVLSYLHGIIHCILFLYFVNLQSSLETLVSLLEVDHVPDSVQVLRINVSDL